MAWRTGSGQIYRTLNGVSWTWASTAGVLDFSAADADTAIRVSLDGTYVTRDGGFTWTPVIFP